MIALERTLPLMVFNPFVVLFIYLPEYTALNFFDAALPLLRFREHLIYLCLLSLLINYLICWLVLSRLIVVRRRRKSDPLPPI